MGMKRYLYAGLLILLMLVGSVIAAQTVSQDRPNADVARWAPAEKALGVKGDAETLAGEMRAALDRTNSLTGK